MEGYSKKEIIRGRAKFIVMSIIGIILFLIPVPVVQDGQKTTTLPVAYLAGALKSLLGEAMPLIILFIVTLSGILSILCSTFYKNKLNPEGLMYSAFNVKWGWLILRVLAVCFVWMTYFKFIQMKQVD